MAHKVVLGGFGSSEKQMRRVAADLSEYYDEDFFGLSFRKANDDSGKLAKIMKGAEAYTHSAGFLAIRHTRPEVVHGIGAPLQAGQADLVGRAALCGYDAAKSSLGSLDMIAKTSRCGRELAAEVALHAAANLGRLGMIASFDAIKAGIAARDAGVRVGLGFMASDRFFVPSADDKQKAHDAQLPLVTLMGGHIDFLLRPVELVVEYEHKYEEAWLKYEQAA